MANYEFKEYSDEDLKHLQEVLLMILKDTAEVLDKHDLPYYLYAGTLLGAVRHGGFIPWDDDIDIFMFREDYDKALPILQKELADKYDIIEMNIQETCFSTFAKISLKGTVFGRWYSEHVDFEIGISIDLFPLDNVPDSDFGLKLHRIFYRLLYQFVINYIVKVDMYTKFSTFMHHSVHKILNFLPISVKTWKKLLTNEMTHYNKKETKKVTEVFDPIVVTAFYREDFEPAIKLKFEDAEFRSPHNYQRILTQCFGENYMELPPEEDRYNNAPKDLDFGKY